MRTFHSPPSPYRSSARARDVKRPLVNCRRENFDLNVREKGGRVLGTRRRRCKEHCRENGCRGWIATLTIIIHLSSRKLFSYVRTKETIVKGIVRSLASFIVSHGVNQFDKSHGQIIRENYPINLMYVYVAGADISRQRERGRKRGETFLHRGRRRGTDRRLACVSINVLLCEASLCGSDKRAER